MTPKKNKLTPRAAIRWLEELRRASERRSGADTIYQIRYMFKYIEKILQYQEVMIPEVEESGRFICPRCKHGMISESGTVDDYAFCPICGQRWKETEDDN